MYRLVVRLISAGALITTVFVTNNVLLVLLAYFVSNTLMRAIFYLLTARRHATNTGQAPESVSFAKHMGFINAIKTGKLDEIMLWHFTGAAPLAVFTFARTPVDQIRKLLQPITSLAFPRFANRPVSEIKGTIIHKLLLYTIAVAPFVIGYILVTPYLYQWFFPQYMNSVIYSQLFSLTLLLKPKELLGSAIQSQARSREAYVSTMIVLPVRIIGMAILIPLYGILGLVILHLGVQLLTYLISGYQLSQMPRA